MRKNRATILVILAVAALIAAFQLRPQVRPLLPRATRVATLSGRFPFYWWLTDDTLLRFQDPAQQDWTFVKHNVKTGARTPLAALTTLFQQSGGKKETLFVSPNGEYLLWTGASGEVHISDIDGSGHYQVKLSAAGENRWMQDGVHWIAVHDINGTFASGEVYSIDPNEKPQNHAMFPFTPSDPHVVNRARMTMTLDNHLLLNYWNGQVGQVTPSRIVALGFGATPSVGGRLLFTPPRDNLKGDLVFAPVSGLLAWTLEYQEPLPTLLSSLTFSAKAPARVSTGIWVMDLHDRTARELGALDTDHADRTGRSGPYNVQWTPDSRHLSFLYNNALWTVPAQ